jgi:DNA-binding IclR family transcriptional regulator
MEERTVQHKERENTVLAPDSANVAPAPMVERAFRLLDLLSMSEAGLTLSELARMLKMSKGSLHGLLKTLESSRVVEQSGDRQYVLGQRIYNLAIYVQGTGLRRFALPAMHRLAASIGEPIFLFRVEHETICLVESVEDGSEQPLPHISVPPGTRIPLLTGAMGRLVLASWTVEQRRAFLRTHPLPRLTEHSIMDPEQLLASVEETARAGIDMCHEEYLTGVNIVAVPITGPTGLPVALLCVFGFVSQFDDEAMQCAGQQLQAEAEAISRSLGNK